MVHGVQVLPGVFLAASGRTRVLDTRSFPRCFRRSHRYSPVAVMHARTANPAAAVSVDVLDTCSTMNMEDREARRGLPEEIDKVYVRRVGVDGERSRWWRIRVVVMLLICLFVISMIVYWLVSAIEENHRRDQPASTSNEMTHLKKLPDHVLPLEYTLKIIPILVEENFTALGDVQIQFYSKISTKHVRLHARKLVVEDIRIWEYLDRSPNASKQIEKYVVADQEDFIDVFLLQILMAGETYILHMKYKIPSLQLEPKGLYRSSHVDRDTNETRWTAISSLSPDNARMAFPCFDEPWLKASFSISIGRKHYMRSHSNSMRKNTEEIHDMPGYMWDHYEKTFPISTYVVAFMVTDFSSYNVNFTDRPSHTIFSRKEVSEDVKHVGDFVPRVLRIIQNSIGFYCALDKLDVIIVPQLSYLAMENWGLLTLREEMTVINKAGGSIYAEKQYYVTTAHEVAHQWFGNLVTPKWWNDVWLKEGFASYFGYWALHELDPASWDLQTEFFVECHSVFENDDGETAHPLHIDLKSLSGLIGIFDLTSYVKGNCMVHMIYHFLGKRIFLQSVRRYIRTYYYRSADQEDLWSVFQVEIDGTRDRLLTSSGLRMKDVMRTWTYQAGFPVLHVRQNRETGAIELTQDRFYHYGVNSSSEELWHIPLTWTTENEQQFGNTLPKAWMVKKRMKINATALSRASFDNRWILFNIDQTALYRVNYDTENWKLLAASFRALPEVTKMQLLSDSIAMSNAGLLNIRIVWRIIEKLEMESGETLWSHAIQLFTTIMDHFWDSKLFKFAMCKITEEVYSKVAGSLVHTDSVQWTAFKVEVMRWACSVGHQACLTVVRNFTEKMLSDESSNSFPDELRTWMYCRHVKAATEEQWPALLKRYESATVDDKESLAFALGCHTNAKLLRRYLFTIFSRKNATCIHASKALTSIASNPHGYQIAKEFLIQHWSYFNAKAEEEDDKYANVNLEDTLRAFARRIRQEEDVKWLQQLRDSGKKYDTVIDDIINRIRTIISWYRDHKNDTLTILAQISTRHAQTRDCKK